jgi:hypothetical protein
MFPTCGPLPCTTRMLVAVAHDLREPARGLLGARDLLFLRAAVFGRSSALPPNATTASFRSAIRAPQRSSGMVMQRGPPRARDNSLPASAARTSCRSTFPAPCGRGGDQSS